MNNTCCNNNERNINFYNSCNAFENQFSNTCHTMPLIDSNRNYIQSGLHKQCHNSQHYQNYQHLQQPIIQQQLPQYTLHHKPRHHNRNLEHTDISLNKTDVNCGMNNDLCRLNKSTTKNIKKLINTKDIFKKKSPKGLKNHMDNSSNNLNNSALNNYYQDAGKLVKRKNSNSNYNDINYSKEKTSKVKIYRLPQKLQAQRAKRIRQFKNKSNKEMIKKKNDDIKNLRNKTQLQVNQERLELTIQDQLNYVNGRPPKIIVVPKGYFQKPSN